MIQTLPNISTLRENCPSMEFFLVCIFLYSTEYRKIRTRKNSLYGHFHTVKGNQTIKFGRLKEYNRNIFLEKSYTICDGETCL